eukprot:scaffold202206_cov26-Tisochrysis_lutea.AAC.1
MDTRGELGARSPAYPRVTQPRMHSRSNGSGRTQKKPGSHHLSKHHWRLPTLIIWQMLNDPDHGPGLSRRDGEKVCATWARRSQSAPRRPSPLG